MHPYQPIDLILDNVKGLTFIQNSPQHYTIETYGGNGEPDDSEALKTPAIALTALVAIIALGLIVAFARRNDIKGHHHLLFLYCHIW